MPNCPLCNSASTINFSSANEKTYYRCEVCSLIFLDEKFFLSPEEEKLRYESHNNDPSDARYIQHLSKLTNELIPFLEKGASGLDYGCGEGKPVSHILNKMGYNVSDYDPFFYPEPGLLKHKYDFITCSETAEHFHHPAKEFDLFNSMLKSNGVLAIMTNFFLDEISFDEWWYPRDPTHVSFYSIETLNWLSDNYEWNILNTDVNNNVVIFRKRS